MNVLGIHDLGTFVAAGLLLNMTPGPDTMYILGRSISQGRAAGIASVLGISAGSCGHTLLAALGLSAILAKSPTLFVVIKWIGAAYLAYLGLRIFLDRSPLAEAAASQFGEESYHAVFRQGMLTNLLNPKVALFFLAFLPQFVDPVGPYRVLPFLMLGAIFIVNGTIWCLFLALCASSLSRGLRRNTRAATVIKRLTGGLFVGLGVKLAVSK